MFLTPNIKSPFKEFNGLFLAGAVGIGPTTRVLETLVIPLHHAPMLTNYIKNCGLIKRGCQRKADSLEFNYREELLRLRLNFQKLLRDTLDDLFRNSPIPELGEKKLGNEGVLLELVIAADQVVYERQLVLGKRRYSFRQFVQCALLASCYDGVVNAGQRAEYLLPFETMFRSQPVVIARQRRDHAFQNLNKSSFRIFAHGKCLLLDWKRAL